MHAEPDRDRRAFLSLSAGAAGLVIARATLAQPPARPDEAKPADAKQEEEVTPAEDLMREHGVLKRILLVYEESIRRIDAARDGAPDLPPESLADAGAIIRTFIEDYHEKLEEEFLFPRFRKAGKHVELVDTLTAQHQAGRRVTETIQGLAHAQSLRDRSDRQRLAGALRAFNRMYAPHEAREDTVLFPALHEIISRNEYDALGEDFEKREHQLFGEDGFEKMVGRVATIEKQLGIYDLAQFTPKV
jgi:hemerythrin-like domain-containing protein